MRLFVLVLTLVLAPMPLLAAPDLSRRPVDIPAQTLSNALEKLARDRGLQIVYLSEATDALQTEGASGELTPDETLARLLRGTGLTYRYLDHETVTIVTSPQAAAAGTVNSNAAPTSALIIEGRRPDLPHQVQTYVRAVTQRSGDQSLTRWRVPICPLVAGMPADQGEFILARLSAIARSAGAPLGPPTCRPNFYVIITAQSQRMRGKPVRVFYDARLETAEGLPLLGTLAADSQGLGNTLSGPTTSDTRIDFPAVTGLASVLVLVDAARVKGLEIGALADYIAMVGFTELDTDVDVGNAPTILRLFTAAAPPAPTGLSEWDKSFLRSLYSTRQTFRLQRSQISRSMVRDLAGTR